MAIALGSSHLVKDVIAIDNAPVDAAVRSDFGRYIQGMKKIDAAKVERLDEADKLLEPYVSVGVYPLSFSLLTT